MQKKFTDEVYKQVVADLFRYKETESISIDNIAVLLGCSSSAIYLWRNGSGRPMVKYVLKMNELGITDVDVSEQLRQQAIQQEITRVDKKNQVPRGYKRRVSIPDVMRNQLKLMIDDYVSELEVPKTFSEFRVAQDEFIDKLVITCNKES